MRFSPSTACDSTDLADGPGGGCAVLTNLIPDPSTKNVWAVKPSPIAIETFSDLSGVGNVDVFIVVGLFMYGLIVTSLNAGKSQPFCYNISNIFVPTPVTVYGIASGNCPTKYAYATLPLPTMVQVGNKIYVTHPGFAGPPYIGWFDISIPTQPVWTADGLSAVGGVLTIGSLVGGAAYDSGGSGVFSVVSLTGGTGSLVAACVFVTSGVVTRVVITGFGTNYIVGDTLTVPALGGTGAGATVTVTSVQVGGLIPLTSVPQWCAQFYQRLWLGINPTVGLPSVIFTDILSGGCTLASQALTFGDTIPTVAGAGLGLNNQLGGIIQSLMIFKGVNYIIQITGDASLNTLAINSLNVATGTTSPRAIVQTPRGLIFAAPDGLREIDFNAQVSDPIGFGGQGLTLPFQYGVISSPYFLALGFNRGVVRITVAYQLPPTAYTISPAFIFTEFMYDVNLKAWSGPHISASVVVEIYGQYCNYSDGWVASLPPSPGTIPGILYGIVSYPSAASSYFPADSVELQTGMLPTEFSMSQLEITEMVIMTTAPAQIIHMTVSILDQDGNTLGTQAFSFNPGTSPSTTLLYPRRIDWVKPVVVTRFAVDIVCTTVAHSLVGFKIGDIYIRVRELGYLQELPG